MFKDKKEFGMVLKMNTFQARNETKNIKELLSNLQKLNLQGRGGTLSKNV